METEVLQNIYLILQFVGIAVLSIGLVIVLLQKPSVYQNLLTIIMITLIFSFIAYILELNAPNVEIAYAGALLGYLGKPFAFLTMFYLLCEYAHIRIPKGIKLIITAYFAFLTLIVLTNNFHHLYYPTWGWKEDIVGGVVLGSKLYITHGPFWYIFMASTFVIFFAYVVVIVYEIKNSKTKQAKEMTFYLLATVLFAIIGLILFLSGVTKGYETTLTGTIIGAISLLILFIKYHIFDSIALAKDQTFDESDNAVIILDAKETISYFNTRALQFIPALSETLTHAQENVLIAQLSQFYENQIVTYGTRVYKVRISELTPKKGNILIGKSYMFIDITEQYKYQDILKADIAKATKRLREIQVNILISFADLIESRDGYTGLHVKNVATYSRRIAEELRETDEYRDIINDTFIDVLELTAPLHDVGKIKIPDHILGKPGKLTDEEFTIMKMHPRYGSEIIQECLMGVEDIANIGISKDIALYHHERFDGTGYPDRLRGKGIPLSARIVAVADVYDALLMERPYKAPFTKEKAIEIIQSESGTHFDPDVVNAFLRIVDTL